MRLNETDRKVHFSENAGTRRYSQPLCVRNVLLTNRSHALQLYARLSKDLASLQVQNYANQSPLAGAVNHGLISSACAAQFNPALQASYSNYSTPAMPSYEQVAI